MRDTEILVIKRPAPNKRSRARLLREAKTMLNKRKKSRRREEHMLFPLMPLEVECYACPEDGMDSMVKLKAQ